MSSIRYATFDEDTETYDVKCDCGHRKIYKKSGINKSKRCPSCLTTKIKFLSKPIEENKIEDIEEDFYFSEFHCLIETKTERKLNLILEGSSGTKKIKTIYFNLSTQSLQLGEDGDLREIEDEDECISFFDTLEEQGVDEGSLIEELGLEEHASFFEEALGDHLFLYVKKLPVQILVHDGLELDGSSMFDLGDQRIINSKETQPHKILGLHKCLYEILKDELDSNYVEDDMLDFFQALTKKYDGSDVKTALSIMSDLGEDIFTWGEDEFDLLLGEDYPSMQKFVRYLYIETKYRQGMEDVEEVVELLSDMIHMAKEMEVEYNLMPSSLKREHDVMTMNHNVVRTKIEKNKFNNVIKKGDYKSLEFQDDDYIILTPKEADDLVKEGKRLNHCVASYFHRVIDEKSKILFMRKKEHLETPLVTIEVCGNTVMQSKGKSNRNVVKEEEKFIKKWAKEKKLIV